MISDGADTATTDLRDVRAALLRSDAFVYAIAIDPADRRPINVSVNGRPLRNHRPERRRKRLSGRAAISASAAEIATELTASTHGYTSQGARMASTTAYAQGARTRTASGAERYVAEPRN